MSDPDSQVYSHRYFQIVMKEKIFIGNYRKFVHHIRYNINLNAIGVALGFSMQKIASRLSIFVIRFLASKSFSYIKEH